MWRNGDSGREEVAPSTQAHLRGVAGRALGIEEAVPLSKLLCVLRDDGALPAQVSLGAEQHHDEGKVRLALGPVRP